MPERGSDCAAVDPLSQYFARRDSCVGIQEENHARRGSPFREFGCQLMDRQRADAVFRQASGGYRTRCIVAAQFAAVADRQYSVTRHSMPRRAILRGGLPIRMRIGTMPPACVEQLKQGS